jgi:membrane-associated protease RseP (regulator of RpoE activity)
VTAGLPNNTDRAVVGGLDCAAATQNVDNGTLAGCTAADPSPASTAGMRVGDEVVAVNGVAVPTFTDLKHTIRSLRGVNTFTVLRGQQRVDLKIDVAAVQRLPENAKAHDPQNTLQAVGAIGVAGSPTLQYGPLAAFGATGQLTGEIFSGTWQSLKEFPQRIPALVRAIGGAPRDANTPVSIVGASRLGGDAAELGVWWFFLLLLANLNFFVGVFNLLPLLPLDGGHIAVNLYQWVRDRIRGLRGLAAGPPVDYTKLLPVTYAFVLCVGALMVLTVTADIVNPITLNGP